MTTFDEREQGYERKFQMEQEQAFKIKARANKLLGLWAAAQLGLTDAAAETYALEIVASELTHHGEDGLITKLTDDFAARGKTIDAAEIQAEIRRATVEAKQQLGVTS
jgi:hypothetical protein